MVHTGSTRLNPRNSPPALDSVYAGTAVYAEGGPEALQEECPRKPVLSAGSGDSWRKIAETWLVACY